MNETCDAAVHKHGNAVTPVEARHSVTGTVLSSTHWNDKFRRGGYSRTDIDNVEARPRSLSNGQLRVGTFLTPSG